MNLKRCHADKTNNSFVKIVSATRTSIQEFENSPLAKTAKVYSLLYNTDFLIKSDNTSALGNVYNEAIEMCRNDPSIIVFVHDDLMICDYFWIETLKRGLEKFDIVGLAGTTRRHKNQCGWWPITPDFKQVEEDKYLSGIISHGTEFPPNNVSIYGEIGKECKLLDGVFLAAYSDTLIKNNLYFDPQFGFHFYDLDFCRQAEVCGLTMGTIPITALHTGGGKYTQSWYDSYDLYLKKWKE